MDATFTKTGPQYTLLLVRRLPYTPEKVWRVLTERELLRQWFPCDVEGEWKVGAELRFIFQHGEDEGLSEEELRGEVLTVEPPSYLEFRWGDHLYRCKLTAEAGGCKLVFSDSFTDASEGARHAAGWEMCLDNLGLLLDGAELLKFVVAVWQDKFDHYVKKFETEAGPQLGLPENYPGAAEQAPANDSGRTI